MNDFGWALAQLKDGRFVTRSGWNGKGMYLGLQLPDEHSMNKQAYIYIVPTCGERVPWVASQPDLISVDWDLSEQWT